MIIASKNTSSTLPSKKLSDTVLSKDSTPKTSLFEVEKEKKMLSWLKSGLELGTPRSLCPAILTIKLGLRATLFTPNEPVFPAGATIY